MASQEGAVTDLTVVISDNEDAQLDKDQDDDVALVEPQQFSAAHQAREKALIAALASPFAGKIVIAERNASIRKADSEYDIVDLTNKLVFWTDASEQSGRVGIGIAWKSQHHSQHWHERSYALEGNFSSLEGEFFAIAEALKIAIQYIRHHIGEDAISEVLIYSDASEVLKHIRDYHIKQRFTRNTELARLKERAGLVVGLGVHLSLEWVKGHKGVRGNTRADALAYAAAQPGNTKVEVLVPSTTGLLTVTKRGKRMTSAIVRNALSKELPNSIIVNDDRDFNQTRYPFRGRKRGATAVHEDRDSSKRPKKWLRFERLKNLF